MGNLVMVTKTVSSSTFTTSFASDENPISEGGIWKNGAAVGLDWRNMQTSGGNALSSSRVTGYDDDIAILTPAATYDYGTGVYIEGVVYRATGYSPSDAHEIELLLHFSISAHDAHGYECLWSTQGHMAIVRWNGLLGDYTPIDDLLTGAGQAADGDVMRFEHQASGLLVAKKNGVVMSTGQSSTTYQTGTGGIGGWPTGTTDSDITKYGWKSITYGAL